MCRAARIVLTAFLGLLLLAGAGVYTVAFGQEVGGQTQVRMVCKEPKDIATLARMIADGDFDAAHEYVQFADNSCQYLAAPVDSVVLLRVGSIAGTEGRTVTIWLLRAVQDTLGQDPRYSYTLRADRGS